MIKHDFLLYNCTCVIFARLKKLQETLRTLQQLESNMSQLRQWLTRVEHQLSTPLEYRHANMQEIHIKLEEQQVSY